jgi:predicted exporter
VLANLCTVSAYGLMSFSNIPVLHDIGKTVATGTFLSLVCAAVLSRPRYWVMAETSGGTA